MAWCNGTSIQSSVNLYLPSLMLPHYSAEERIQLIWGLYSGHHGHSELFPVLLEQCNGGRSYAAAPLSCKIRITLLATSHGVI